MTADQGFLLVWSLFYLWQCCHWLRPGSFALIGDRGACRLRQPDPQFESRLGSPVVGRILPPFRALHSVTPCPISVDQDHVVAFQERCWSFHGRPRQSGRTLALDRIGKIEADGHRVKVDGEPFVEAADETAALDLVDLLGDLIDAPREERARLIEEALAGALDPDRVDRRLTEIEAEFGALRWRLYLLFAVGGLLLPLALLGAGAAGSWILLLPLLLLGNLLVVSRFVVAHARLHPELRAERLQRLVVMTLFVPETMRAHDYLTRFALSGCHALPVLARLAGADDAARQVGLILRDLRHPIPPIEDLGAAARRVVDFMRELETRLVLERADPELLARALALGAPADRHCPRCQAETGAAICDTCRLATVA
ncbi:MAG: hypothetical protein H6807_14620 [Planctomycetes bacterium]|nr:hypothetical protein [Planctomycetota bacterium]